MRVLPSTVEEYTILDDHRKTIYLLPAFASIVFLPGVFLWLVIPIVESANFSDNLRLFLFIPIFIICALLSILSALSVNYLFDKKDVGRSFKIGTFMLIEENSPTKKFLWDKLRKKLNEDELVTFKILLPNFDGSIEDLIIVSKDCAKV